MYPAATNFERSRYAAIYSASDDRAHPLSARFIDFVNDRGFHCVGAKAALNRDGMRFAVARDLSRRSKAIALPRGIG